MQLAYEHESHRAELLEAEAAQQREEEGWWNAVAAVGTIVIGTVAIVCTAGMATPVVVTAVVAGSCSIAYGTSNLFEAGQDIYYGSIGDAHTAAINPIRDTVFMGNQELYDIWGGISTTVAGFVVPVGQAYTAAKAAGQTTKAVVGVVGKEVVKEVAQDTFVGAISAGTGNVVMDLTGDANLSRLTGLGTGFFAGGKTNKVFNSVDNVSDSVKALNHIDDVTDVTKALDDVTDSRRTMKSFSDLMSPEDATRYIANNEKAFFNEFSERASAAGLSDVQITEAFEAMRTGDYAKMATYFDTSSPVDGAVFWSGNKEGAAAYANGIGGTIMEQTPGGQVFDNWRGLQGMYPEWDTMTDLNQKPIWDALSSQYANGAEGMATYVHPSGY